MIIRTTPIRKSYVAPKLIEDYIYHEKGFAATLDPSAPNRIPEIDEDNYGQF